MYGGSEGYFGVVARGFEVITLREVELSSSSTLLFKAMSSLIVEVVFPPLLVGEGWGEGETGGINTDFVHSPCQNPLPQGEGTFLI